MELDIDELKILLVNLSSKLDMSTDDKDKVLLNNKIELYKTALKDKYQSTINGVFNSIVEMCNISNAQTVTEFQDSVLLKLNSIIDCQKELQGVDDVKNIYFTHLVIPINSTNMPVGQVQLSPVVVPLVETNPSHLQSIQPTIVPPVLGSLDNQIPILPIPQLNITDPDVLNRLQNLNTKISSGGQVNVSKRTTVQNFINAGNYNGLYNYLKGSDMKVQTDGVEDLLSQPLIGNMTVLDKVKAIEPVFDYVIEEVDEQPIQSVRNF